MDVELTIRASFEAGSMKVRFGLNIGLGAKIRIFAK